MATSLLPIPHPRNLGMSHFLLKLKKAIHKRLTRRRTTRNINIDRNDTIAAPGHGITIMIISASVGTTSHTDDPSGIGHLIVDLAEGGSHFVGEGAGDDHHVALAGGGAEDYAKAVLVVARGGEVHHFDGAAG